MMAALGRGRGARGRRGAHPRPARARALGGAVAAALIADDASNGLRPLRRATAARKTTWNVVAEAGDPEAERTLVLLAHHDAAHTGAIFDQTFQRSSIDGFPGWSSGSTPRCRSGGPRSRARRWSRSARRAGGAACRGRQPALCALSAAAAPRHPPQPGRPRRQRQPERGRGAGRARRGAARAAGRRACGCMLVSCGAEEVLQGGIYGFARRHLAALDPERTWVLNLDTLGSPELALLEGEGPLVMEDYFDRGFRDLIARVAEREGMPMRRGMRARSSTDAVVPSRLCFPTATLRLDGPLQGALQLPHAERHAREPASTGRSPARPTSPRRSRASSPPRPKPLRASPSPPRPGPGARPRAPPGRSRGPGSRARSSRRG